MGSVADTLSGSVENVVFVNKENDYTVMEILTAESELVTAVGNIPSVSEGEVVVLKGSWTYHKEFGKQFSFVSFEKTLPKEIDGIIQYLSSRTIKGVGPVTALKIVNKYGTDTFDVIENHPEWLADIPGITPKKAAEISKSFSEQSELRGVMMFFKDYIGNNEITKVYKKLGVSAVGIVKKNPYILCEGECGISFEKADNLAASLGVAPDNDDRVLSGINYILSYNAGTNGHTCLPKDKAIYASSELLGISPAVVSEKLESFIESEDIKEYSDGQSIYVMTPDVYSDEELIARKVKELGRGIARFSASDISSLIASVESEMGVSYATLQREAIFKTFGEGFTVITGGPGTGKTTIIKALIVIFKKLGFKTVLAAPTGRAAKRMSEATSEEAKTVHRMLEMERTEGDGIRFGRNMRNPLDEKVVIVDEASMIDLSLMAALMRAMPRGARLVLIGDSDQLPSVGAGNVLADLISSGVVSTVRLTEIFRQSEKSLIVKNSHDINNGKAPRLNATDGDFFFVRREDERELASAVANLIMERLPNAYGEGIREGIQVITPSRKGLGGVEVLNKELQARINPPAKFKKEKTAHGTIFREGDRVMQTTNNYEVLWEKNGIEGAGIFNGDIGVIESIDNVNDNMNIRFDDRLVIYGFENLDELELSYAITVHKSQGSEYPVVIVPMYSCPVPLMTRNLLYTAVTRAKRMVVLVGRSDIAYRMVDNNREVMRYTMLREKIIDYQ